MSGYHAKKRLGQNFLKDKAVIAKTIALLDVQPADRVVEIGPGRGSLTLPLAETGCHVTAVEYDRDLIGYLEKLLRKFPNVEIINQDFLKYDPEDKQIKLLGNIPYNLSSPVIDWLIAHHGSVARAVIMVQREVANRMAAMAGSKDWSPLAIFAQLHFNVEAAMEVPPEAFSPVPEITSSVVVFEPRDPIDVGEREHFEQLVRAAFSQRRKQLINNLVPSFAPDAGELRRILEETGLTATVRAEEIGIAEFIELARRLRPTSES